MTRISPAALALIVAVASPTAGSAQAADTAMMARVRSAFLHAWDGYTTYAAGHDALRPISGTPHDWYGTSLLMTPIDAYDTMLLMGLSEEAAAAKAMVMGGLTFDVDVEVQVFEVVIRLLGGLLSAYQLDGDGRWLDLAVDLADRLMPAFDSPTGMPYRYVHLRTGATRDPLNNPAEIGTLVLELGTVSRLTGDRRYYDAAKGAVLEVWNRRSRLDLVGEVIDVRTGEWANPASHVGGRIDSWYEYLLKAWLLFGDEELRDMYRESIAAVNRHVADERFDGLWYGRVDMGTGDRLATTFGALEAFLPGLLALGGDTTRAARLQENVARMWTLHGIEPEQLDYSTMDVTSPGYPLRPEAIESAYYLFRITGEEKWRDMGRQMFDAIVEHARVEHGFAHVADVRTMDLEDAMESFFLAETLKYAWLLAAPASTLELDAVVFNTEAHPLRRFRR
jgi:mannosidase alpha-like ER degradation enhancer 2